MIVSLFDFSDDLSSETLWEKLNDEEKGRFLRALNDPEGDLAREMLNSEFLLSENVLPWWERPTSVPEEERPPSPRLQRYGPVPLPVEVPSELSSRATAGPSLIFNIATSW